MTEARGVPVGLAVDGANRHDMKLVRATLDSVPMPRPTPGPETPQGMCLDKGYDYGEVRRTLAEFGFAAHIRSRGEPESGRGGKGDQRAAEFKARRWVVERTHSWLNRFRRILALGQGPRALHRLPSFRLCPHRPQSCRIIRIGSKPRIRQSASPGCNQLYPTEITLNNPVYKVLAHHLVTLGVGMQVVR